MNNEPNSPSQEHLSLNQYQKNPLEWCQRLINLGLSGPHGDPAKMVAIIGRGMQLGLDPYSSLESIYQVSGKTALLTDMMHALVERSGLLQDKRHEYSGKDGTRTCTVWMRRLNRTEQAYSYSMADARLAGLVKPVGGWAKHPDSMLYARAMAFALRREFPEILRGIHSVEELYSEPEPQPLKVIEPEEEKKPLEKPPERVKRHRRTKAEMLEAAKALEAAHQKYFAKETQSEVSSPPAQDEDFVDIDKAIPKEVTPYDRLVEQADRSGVSQEEVLTAAKQLRLAFEETELKQIHEDKIKRLMQHWPVVLGTISREKAKVSQS